MSKARQDGDGAVPGAALDGVGPPPGQGPTLAVWREYGIRKDRWAMRGIIALIYLVMFFAFSLSEGLRVPSIGLLLLPLVVSGGGGLLHSWSMTSRRHFLAAGRSWLMKSTGIPKRSMPYRWIRLDDLEAVTVTMKRKFVSDVAVVHFVDRQGGSAHFTLTDLQACPPMLDLINAAISRAPTKVKVDKALADAFRRHHPAAQTISRGAGTDAAP